MNSSRWYILGFPLVLIGVFWIYCVSSLEVKNSYTILLYGFGGASILVGLIAVLEKPWTKRLLQMIWLALMLISPLVSIFLIPLIVALGIMALKTLRDDPVENEKIIAEIKAIAPQEAMRLAKEEAVDRFGINEYQLPLSLVNELRFAPADVIAYLEDLELEYGFDLEHRVTVSSVSVDEVMNLVSGK